MFNKLHDSENLNKKTPKFSLGVWLRSDSSKKA